MVLRVQEGLTYLASNIAIESWLTLVATKMAFIVKGHINEEHNIVYPLNSDVAFTH